MVFYSPTKLVNYFVRRLFLMDFYVVFRDERVGCRRTSTAKLPGMVWLSGNNGVACWPTRQWMFLGTTAAVRRRGFPCGRTALWGGVGPAVPGRVCSAPCCCLQGVGCQFCQDVCQVFFCFGLFLLAVVDVFHLEEVFQQGEFAFLESLH